MPVFKKSKILNSEVAYSTIAGSTKNDLTNLMQLALVLNRQYDFNEILRVVANKTADLLHAETALIMMINPSTQETIKTVIREGKKLNSRQFHTLQAHITGWMIDNHQSLISTDIKIDPRFAESKMHGLPIKSTIAVLLISGSEILGSIIVFNSKYSHIFTAADLSLLESIAVISAPHLRNLEKIREFFAPNISESALLKKYEEMGLIGTTRNLLNYCMQ